MCGRGLGVQKVMRGEWRGGDDSVGARTRAWVAPVVTCRPFCRLDTLRLMTVKQERRSYSSVKKNFYTKEPLRATRVVPVCVVCVSSACVSAVASVWSVRRCFVRRVRRLSHGAPPALQSALKQSKPMNAWRVLRRKRWERGGRVKRPFVLLHS
jgi:hypothetical protein